MGRIVVTEFVSIDGVMEDPGGSEDFEHGGWVFEIDQGDGGRPVQGRGDHGQRGHAARAEDL